MRKLKIVHAESHNQWGGQERRVLNESVWMKKQGHHLTLLAPKDSPVFEYVHQAGIEVYHVPFKNWTMAADFFRVRKILKQIQPDVFNTHGNIDAKVGLSAAAGLGIPCIIRSRHTTPPVKNLWYNRLLYHKLCHIIVTTANSINQQLIHDLHVPPNHITTISSGIIPPAVLPDRQTIRENIIASRGLSSDSVFIGYLGRLAPEKGIDCLIDAFAELAPTMSNYYLILVGEGGERSAIETKIRNLGISSRVVMTGYQDNPWPYFTAFDCLVLVSSEYEAIPQVILQAMYARCPIIGAKVGGILDVVKHRRTGLLVPPNNPPQLAQAILETITNPEATAQMVQQAYQVFCDHHTIDAMGHKMLAVYQQFI